MKNDMRLDGRVSPKRLYEKRKQVVALHRKGMRLNAICETTGLCWKAVRKAIDLYESGGARALQPKKWGRPVGTSRTLTPEQEKQVQKDICDKRPEPNPDERLNADLKHAITTSVPRQTRQGLLKKTTEHMNMVKSSPERVKTNFKGKHVAYAAEST